MATPDLPPELAELERRLQQRHKQEPSASLRQRVLDAGRGREPVAAGGFWRFAAAVVAAALLAINLSMSAANNTDWRLAGDAPRGDVAGGSDDGSDREARRQALLFEARSRLAPAGPVSRPTSSLRMFSDE
jgi:hypothetical protein